MMEMILIKRKESIVFKTGVNSLVKIFRLTYVGYHHQWISLVRSWNLFSVDNQV